jgi:hypothetical protein|tara:strand:+ start:443 stop:562 length:120 start_codon:yes stop_codon:yes gene_type:complete
MVVKLLLDQTMLVVEVEQVVSEHVVVQVDVEMVELVVLV